MFDYTEENYDIQTFKELKMEIIKCKGFIRKLQEKEEAKLRHLQVENETKRKEIKKLNDALNYKNREIEELRLKNLELEDGLKKYRNHIRIKNQELEDLLKKYQNDARILQKEKEESQNKLQNINERIEAYESRVNEMNKQVQHLRNQIQEGEIKLENYRNCYEMVYGSNDMEDFGTLVLSAMQSNDWNPPLNRLGEIKYPYLVSTEFTKAVQLYATKNENILVSSVKENLNFFVGLLINAGLPVDYTLDFCCGQTLLHVASNENNVVLINFLIKREANINKKDWLGFTPLHVAVKCGPYEATRFLINNGADVHAETDAEWTALHLSAKKGDANLIKLLLNAGSNKYTAEIRGKNALGIAIDCNRNTEILTLLQP